MKKKMSLLLVFTIIFSMLVPLAAAPDYSAAGKTLSDLNILKGDENGALMLNNKLKRQDMVIMISRLYKEEETAKKYNGVNSFKDLTSQRSFYIPYITWARDKKLIEGMGDKEFGFNRLTTVQEFQTILLRALNYQDKANNWNEVPNYAKKIGIMENVDVLNNKQITRGEMSQMVLNALGLNINGSNKTLADKLDLTIPNQFKAKVTVDKDIVTFEGTTKGTKELKITVRPISQNIKMEETTYIVELDKGGYFQHQIKDLEIGKYEYRLEGDNSKTIFQEFEVKTGSFRLVDIKVKNLKEIVLSFDKPVDTKSSSFIDKYQTNAGEIQNIDFNNENKDIILRLKNNMVKDAKYYIKLRDISSNTGVKLSLDREEFVADGGEVPKIIDKYGFKNTLTLKFNTDMALEPIVDKSNYYIQFNNELILLPNNTKLDLVDSRTLNIIFPEYMSGQKVVIGENIKHLEIRGLTDVIGNNTDPVILKINLDSNNFKEPKAIDFYNNIPGKQGVLENEHTIKVKFNVPILEADKYDFAFSTGEIGKVVADGSNVVTIHLDKNFYTTVPKGALKIHYRNNIKTNFDIRVPEQSLDIIDNVQPRVLEHLNYLTIEKNNIYIRFSEGLETEGATLYSRDIVINDRNGRTLSENEYSVRVDANNNDVLLIHINNPDNAPYNITIGRNGQVSYIKDKEGNLAISSGPYQAKN